VIASALLVVTVPVSQLWRKFSQAKLFLQAVEFSALEKLVTSPRILAPVKIRERR
jgi:hypothetical protein